MKHGSAIFGSSWTLSRITLAIVTHGLSLDHSSTFGDEQTLTRSRLPTGRASSEGQRGPGSHCATAGTCTVLLVASRISTGVTRHFDASSPRYCVSGFVVASRGFGSTPATHSSRTATSETTPRP